MFKCAYIYIYVYNYIYTPSTWNPKKSRVTMLFRKTQGLFGAMVKPRFCSQIIWDIFTINPIG